MSLEPYSGVRELLGVLGWPSASLPSSAPSQTDLSQPFPHGALAGASLLPNPQPVGL